jgi:hypothetical protein
MQRAEQAAAEGREIDDDDEDELEAELHSRPPRADDDELQRELHAPPSLPSMLSQSFGAVSAPQSVLAALPPGLAGSPAQLDAVAVHPLGSQLTEARLAGMLQRWRTIDLSLPVVRAVARGTSSGTACTRRRRRCRNSARRTLVALERANFARQNRHRLANSVVCTRTILPAPATSGRGPAV